MSKKPIVILVGPPGSGKTTNGRLLAECLGWQFVDTDAVISENCGCSIAELFERQGEAHFRELETEILRGLLQEYADKNDENGIVIGTGGGIVVREENRALLQSIERVCYLTADINVLAGRLSGDASRPLLKTTVQASEKAVEEDADLQRRKKLRNLLDTRKSAYEESGLKIDTGGLTPEGVVQEILRLLSLSPRTG